MTNESPSTARLAAFLLVFLAAATLAACGADESTPAPAPDYDAAIEEAPRELAALYAGGSALIRGGEEAYDSTLEDVRGYPVVVNHWGSWCGPCREEFPYFQSQSAQHLDEVAFLGVDTEDAPEAYETFLRDNPIPYPSVEDPDGDFSRWIETALVGQPNTVFYDRDGELVFTHQGPYTSEEDLAADIEKYALSS